MKKVGKLLSVHVCILVRVQLNQPCPADTYLSKAPSLFRIRKNARRALSTPLSDTLWYPSFVCWANGARDDHLATCRMDPSKTSRENIFFQFFFHLRKVQTSLPQEMSPMCVVRLATWSGHPSSVGLLLAIFFFRQFHPNFLDTCPRWRGI